MLPRVWFCRAAVGPTHSPIRTSSAQKCSQQLLLAVVALFALTPQELTRTVVASLSLACSCRNLKGENISGTLPATIGNLSFLVRL